MEEEQPEGQGASRTPWAFGEDIPTKARGHLSASPGLGLGGQGQRRGGVAAQESFGSLSTDGL